MKYKKREYDSGDKLIYAWQKDDMYGCHNDIATLLYDRLIKHCIIPRRPNSLIVDNEYSIGYGFGVSRTKTWLDNKDFVLQISIANGRQMRFAKRVCNELKVHCEDCGDVVQIIIPLSDCDMRIDEYLKANNLSLQLSNRKGFKQFGEESEWRRYDLCSLILTT